ncbi:MAG: putative RNA-binding protein (virulence factor B family) [Bacteroidia bacterium]|jgi:predicted RNA-binding protein (virulence factor B family)
MLTVGQYHNLTVLRNTSVGMFLGDLKGSEILLPIKYIPAGLEVDDDIDVFVYKDSEDRPIATTLKPLALPGEFAVLTVNDVSGVGAFLEMGLEKELLVPYKEQNQNLTRGKNVLVYVYLDEVTNRLVASCKTNKFVEREDVILEEQEEVDLLIGPRSDVGINVIINNKYAGLLYENEVFDKVRLGDKRKGYIYKLREDGKIDVRLQPTGYENIDAFEQLVMDALDANDGQLPIGDKSPPENIYALLKMSKKNFKKAAGGLYKKKLILIEPKQIIKFR